MRWSTFCLCALAALTLVACDREPLTPDLTGALKASEEPIELPPPPGPLEDLCDACPGLFTGHSEENCYGGGAGGFWDADEDGLMDACEHGHAGSFAPKFVFAMDCNWDDGLGRMGGEYFFAAERKIKFDRAAGRDKEVTRIVYLPAYYRDCGSADALGQDPPHSGDSEFVIIDIFFDGRSNHWVTDAIFLSAHCPSSDCRWQSLTGFKWVDDRARGAPIIWVAQHKHSNYRSREECNGGGFLGYDTCAANSIYLRFPAHNTQQNIGYRDHRTRDCGGPLSSSDLVDPTATECMWSWEPPSCPNPVDPFHPVRCNTPLQRFNGWQGNYWGKPPMPYGQILQHYAGF